MKQQSKIAEKIIEALWDEHVEHESCHYDFGCMMTSKTLAERLDKILTTVIQESEKRGREMERKEWLGVSEKYGELIMAVGNKYPGETRHQTALRYIVQAEEGDPQAKTSLKPTSEENATG